MKNFVLFTMFLIILSCSKDKTNHVQRVRNGIKITTNTNKPSNKKFDVKLKEEVFINLGNISDSTRFCKATKKFKT